MKFLQMLFALLQRFINFDPAQIRDIKEQAAAWEKENREKDNWLGKVIRYQERWYMQLGFAVLLLILIKAVSNWLMSTSDTLDDDDDEDDDVPIKMPKKFNLV